MINITGVFRLARDPEVSSLPSGVQVCRGSLCSNGSNGEPTFKSYEVFANAKNWATYLKKGSLIEISGELITQSWDDRTTNQKRFKEVIKIHAWSFVGSKEKDSEGQDSLGDSSTSIQADLKPLKNSVDDIDF